MKQIYESLKQYEEGRDKNPAQIAGSLIELGEKYQSAWLKERGKRYWEGKKGKKVMIYDNRGNHVRRVRVSRIQADGA